MFTQLAEHIFLFTTNILMYSLSYLCLLFERDISKSLVINTDRKRKAFIIMIHAPWILDNAQTTKYVNNFFNENKKYHVSQSFILKYYKLQRNKFLERYVNNI